MKKTKLFFYLSLSALSFHAISEEINWSRLALKNCRDLTGTYSFGELEEKETEVCREIICKKESGEETKRMTVCHPKVAESQEPQVAPVVEEPVAGNPEVEVIIPPPVIKPELEEEEKESIEGAITSLQQVEETIKVFGYPLNCDPKTGLAQFDREEPRDMISLGRSMRKSKNNDWDEIIEFNKDHSIERDFAFRFMNEGVNEIAGPPLDKECETRREWKFVSKDGSRQESFMWVTDEAGTCKTSHRMESMFFIIPRTTRPSIRTEGEELHVTLPTGEKVIYDKKIKIIKSGVLKEGPIDLLKDHRKRGFAPMVYSGSGIVIRSDQRGADPRQNPKGKKVFNAIITQGDKVCEIPRTELWSQNEKHFHFKFSDDQKLLEFINSKCEQKFSF